MSIRDELQRRYDEALAREEEIAAFEITEHEADELLAEIMRDWPADLRDEVHRIAAMNSMRLGRTTLFNVPILIVEAA